MGTAAEPPQEHAGSSAAPADRLFDFANLVEDLPGIVYLDYMDESELSVFVSKRLEEILGYPTSDWLMDDEFWFNHLHPADRRRAWDTYQASIDEAADRHDEYRMIAADGRIVWIEERARIVPDGAGGKGIIQGILLDITERKRAEELKDTLLRAVSHDLKSPLAAIIGSVETLLMPHLSFSDEVRDEFLRGVLRGAKRMDQIVSDLLDLERLETGLLEPRLETVDLVDLLRSVAEETEPPARERIVVDPTPALARVDRVMVERAVDNLVRNALRHSPADDAVLLSARCDDDEASVLVADKGPGIPAEEREAIFEPFVQLGAPQGGAGIGLALVRALVELHGGSVSVEDGPDGGAVFTLTIPT